MKIYRKMTIGEFAAIVASYLQSKGISTVLTGGAVVSIYTENKYMSYDADFISPADQKSIGQAMQELGFEQHGKEFRHKQTDFFVEFPSGPLAIGDQLVHAESELDIKGYKLKLLSPTQSVMDRLAAYFHWNDLQWVRVPFKNLPKYYFSTYDEVFFNFNHPEWTSIYFFEQNRAFIGIGKELAPNTLLDVGYLNQIQFGPPKQISNIFLVSISVNILM